MRNKKIEILMLLTGILVVIILIVMLNAPSANSVDIWLTTSDQRNLLTQQEPLVLEDIKETDVPIIQVDPNVSFQTMEGFGAAVTGSSAYLINHEISSEQREALLYDLFSSEGIRLSFIRHAIGASDFSVDRDGNPLSYTYNDMESGTDYELEHFSIDNDADVISLIQDIRTIDNQVKIMGTPWTAPAWMKYSNQLNGSYLNYEDERVYEAYANYFVKYIQAYEDNQIPIDAITIQNEPEHTSESYPTMSMNAEEQAMFIKQYLQPAFSQHDIHTKILAYDHNWENAFDYSNKILRDEEANAYTSGIAFHCYEGDPESMSKVHEAYPDKHIYLTECSGGDWSADFGDNLNWYMSNLIIGGPRNWAEAVLLWNIALDSNGGPTNGGCSDCRGVVTVNKEANEVSKNVEYYALGHASKFVNPGAVRISTTHYQGKLETVGFQNPDDSMVLIVANTSDHSETFQVNYQTESFTYTIEPNSAATFTW
ncbi:glycoside hydrolase family 30 beta sandwich domain-containing protein [Ornithinibacillus sp. JPR2-1]|uniref:glycoside hydrolase family 30 protein n=1 Tax=Ornithinibacillus sp. JPR2-1 TaxID=2094019 RepID=UPI0031D4548A